MPVVGSAAFDCPICQAECSLIISVAEDRGRVIEGVTDLTLTVRPLRAVGCPHAEDWRPEHA